MVTEPKVISVDATERGRFYTMQVGDEVLEPMPSVTNVLQVLAKPALIRWAENQGRDGAVAAALSLYDDVVKSGTLYAASSFGKALTARIGKERTTANALNKAQEIGTQAHAMIEWTLRKQLGLVIGEKPAIRAEAQRAFDAWMAWATSAHLKPLRVEMTVCSRTHQFAGTFDLLAEVDDALTVLDWKTGKGIYAEAHLQNAAYRVAVEELGFGTPARGILVRLPKLVGDPDVEPVEAESGADMFDTFLDALRLWHWWSREEEKSKAKYASRWKKKSA